MLETGRETSLEHAGGLGLWLVNWTVTGFGGAVTTTVEDGTTVTLALPQGGDAADGERRDYRWQAAVRPGTD